MSPPAVGSSVAPHHGTYPSEENTTANHLTAYCEYCHDLFTEHIWFISFVPSGRRTGASSTGGRDPDRCARARRVAMPRCGRSASPTSPGSLTGVEPDREGPSGHSVAAALHGRS